MEKVAEFNKENCVKWLAGIGASTSGSKQELTMRKNRLSMYPGLVQKLKAKSEKAYVFPCSLDSVDIPPATAKWRVANDDLPMVNNKLFTQYVSMKREGSAGQQKKALQMFTSRKIVNIKTFVNEQLVYVKAMIKKSYGTMQRPAVIMFENGIPTKAHCSCPVGLSGICCHVLALLLFLKHYHETGERIQALTCTEQLQKWHRSSHKSSIPMVPLRELKVKSAVRAETKGGSIQAADPQNSTMKRDVQKMREEMKSGIIKIEKTFKPFEHHVYTVLQNSTIGPTTSLYEHLEYRHSLRRTLALVDHDYCEESYCQERVNCNHETKMDLITSTIQRALTAKCVAEVREETDKKQVSNPVTVDTSKVLYEANSQENITEVSARIEAQLQEKRPLLTINISNLKAPCPCGPNYHDVLQNTDVWEDLRKFKITGSRLPALLGSHGQEKFIKHWKVVKLGLKESDVINTNFENFKRGHKFEKEAISVFCSLSNSETQTCGFFEDPSDSNYGASPDALAASSIILEVKTRAVKTEGPLSSLKQLPSYFIQPQLEMVCTGASYCILESYHPETQQASFFLIKRDDHDVLMSVIKDITNSILNEKPLLEWSHSENSYYKRLGENVAGRIPDFASIKPLRSYINALVKSIPRVEFSK